MQTSIVQKAVKTLKEDGVKVCFSKTQKYINKKIKENRPLEEKYKDVLFISGCNEDLPHPWRYRVTHQREQLEAYNYTTDEVFFQDLRLEQIRGYRMFIFFRCPYTDLIGEFVLLAKRFNKKVIYDIDDLVIDTKYTNLIKFVCQMNTDDKRAYDDNVMNMQKLLKKCDMAITSTRRLEIELKNYISDVYVNRNTASEEMVQLSKAVLLKGKSSEKEAIKIGYFSGSITHNADFELILPVIAKVMKNHSNVELYVVGELDIPDELKCFAERITKLPFGDWRKLPEMIASVDINLAPLEDTIFNEAKSENKWVEAALVKVVTVASDVGAFHECIENEKTGFLCKSEEDWESTLEKLILDPQLRYQVADHAYEYCLTNCTTMNTGKNIKDILNENVSENYGFILPGLEISGGTKVALKHASFLQKNGKDVTLFLLEGKTKMYEFEGVQFPVIDLSCTEMCGNIGCAIATMWTTVDFVDSYNNINDRCYLVQNFETDFYKEGDSLRKRANVSYTPHHDVRFLTISKWCESWLKEKYGQTSEYAPNGIDIENFLYHKRKFGKKIRILIEGDCAVDYKNVDEAFRIVEKLSPQKYEVWYMSYNGEPKKWYRVDEFFHKVPYAKVPEIYAQCDILLKTSLLESFSYPPLEMMATGGYVVAVPNGGNVEYMKDNDNCIFYEAGNIEQALNAITSIVENNKLQEKLSLNGRHIAELRDWENIEKDIMALYVK